MARAFWNGTLIAESEDIVRVEGNAYFPESALIATHFEPSDTHTTCGWKGIASYYTVVVDDARNKDAAWYYADPKPAADEIRGRIAFWKGVEIVD